MANTKQDKAEALELASQLQDTGVPCSLIVSQLRTRFGYSRAQAYRIVAEAGEARGKEGIHPQVRGDQLIKMAQRIVADTLLQASLDGNTKDVGRLAKELRELCRADGSVTSAQAPADEPELANLQAAYQMRQVSFDGD
jgi:hypothetical protein